MLALISSQAERTLLLLPQRAAAPRLPILGFLMECAVSPSPCQHVHVLLCLYNFSGSPQDEMRDGTVLVVWSLHSSVVSRRHEDDSVTSSQSVFPPQPPGSGPPPIGALLQPRPR